MSNELRTGRHCCFLMHVHLVFVTKYRKKVFKPEHIMYLKTIFKNICEDFEAKLVECDGEKDHVHLLINYPPKISVSSLVNSLKGVSSRRIKKDFPDLKQYYWKSALWSSSYFAGSCGGAPINIIKKYIENQNTLKR